MGSTLAAIITILGILFGSYAGFRLSFLVMLSTQAFVSAYSIVRGVSLILGGFPNELLIIRDLFGFTDSFQPDFYFMLYIMAIAILSAVSLRFQMQSIFQTSTRDKRQMQEDTETRE
jgi:hypothetical protein